MMKRLSFVQTVPAVVAAALLCAVFAPPRAEATRRPALRLVTREVSLGREHTGELKGTRTVSPDRRRVVFVAKVAGGEAVYVDGVAGKTYPAVASDPLSEAGLGSPFTFSPDGRRVAYVANFAPASSRARGPRRVVVDGVEGAAFDYIWTGSPHFSKDGRHFAYRAERGGKHFVVVDGKESKPYDLVHTPVFGGDGARVAFEAVRDKQTLFVVDGREFAADDPEGQALFYVGAERAPYVVERDGKRFVLWRDKQSGPFDEVSGYTLSTSGGRVTFVAKRGGKEFAVVDGKESKPYDAVGQPDVSPKGGRVMFVAREGEASFAVVDGVEGARYDSVGIGHESPFSPDGAHYAYKATREGDDSLRSFVVADGKEGKGYDFVDHVAYTPDGAHLLYVAYSTARYKTFLVRDGEEVASYDNLPDFGGFRFGPDGRRMFFRLRELDDGKEAIVVDGRAFHYDDITDAEFGPDGRRFVFKAQRGGVWVMVVDGVESEAYEPDGDEPGKIGWSRDGRLAFSKDGSRVAYVGRKGGKEFVVADGVAAAARYDAIGNLAFTPDGRHVVHTARRGGKSFVVVDGVEGREYDGFLPARDHERDGRLNVEGANSLSILARRGTELLRVELEVVEN
jgi:hypothetical protein